MFPSIPIVLGYLGPDTLLPLGSALAAILGVILLFGRRTFDLAQAALRKLRGQAPDVEPNAAGESAGEAQE